MKKDPLADILSVPESKDALSDRERVSQRLNVLINDLTQIYYRNYTIPSKDKKLAYYLQDLIPQIKGMKKEINNLNVSYEDGMKIAEQYKGFERKIAKQQKLLDEVFLLAKDTRDERIYDLLANKKHEDESYSKEEI